MDNDISGALRLEPPTSGDGGEIDVPVMPERPDLASIGRTRFRDCTTPWSFTVDTESSRASWGGNARVRLKIGICCLSRRLAKKF